jgi:hypothetical protein
MFAAMRARVVAAAVVGLVSLLASSGQASAQLTASIVVEGNRRVETSTVRSYFESSSGKLDDATLDAGLKRLLATNLFATAEIKRDGGQIKVHVVEAPLIGKIAFEGNKKVDDKKLVAVVQSKAGGALQKATVQADVERIREVYRGSGRDDVRIVPQTIVHGERLDLVFDITEGAKTPVKQISFIGSHAFSDRQLKAVIKTGESNVLSFLLSNDIYDPDKVEADRELLRRYYLAKGYADVSVPSASAEYDPDKKAFNVKFIIDEGAVYRFGDINLVSNVPGLQSSDLQRRLVARPGREVRQHRAREVDRRDRDRTRQARLSLRQDRSPHRARCRYQTDHRQLHDPERTAGLCRAHRDPWQHPHPRLRDPPRIRFRRGRSLQQDPDRPRRAASEKSRLLQVGQDRERGRLRARPRRAQRQYRGTIDRRFQYFRRLFDHPPAPSSN